MRTTLPNGKWRKRLKIKALPPFAELHKVRAGNCKIFTLTFNVTKANVETPFPYYFVRLSCVRTIFNNKLNKAFHTSEENDYFDSSTFKPGAAVDKANQIIEDVYATGKDKGHVPYYWSSEKFLSDLQVYKAMDDYKWSREELTTYARIIITLVNLGLNGKEGYEYSGRTQEAIGYALAGATTDVIADKVGYVDPSDWSIPIYWITQNIGEFFSGRKATKAKEAIRYYLYVSKVQFTRDYTG